MQRSLSHGSAEIIEPSSSNFHVKCKRCNFHVKCKRCLLDIDRYGTGKLRRIQAEGFDMPNIDKATDAEIDRYVMGKLRRIQAEGFDMPNVDKATDADTDADTDRYVMGKLTSVRTDSTDDLTAKLIQRLPRNHRLHNFSSDIRAWLEEVDKSSTRAKCNKLQRSAYILSNFGIHTESTLQTYRRELVQSCGKAKPNAQAAHNDAKILHLTRNPFPIGDLIQDLMQSRKIGGNTDMLAALRARESIAADLLLTDRICTWIYWTAMQHAYRRGG